MNFVPDVAAAKRCFAITLWAFLATSGCSGSDDNPQLLLDALQVAGTKTMLNPTFDPKIFRYSVIANEVPGDVEFTAAAPDWAIISVNGAMTSSNTAQSVGTLSPGDVVQIEVHGRGKNQAQSAQYEIVYLPADFPELSVTTLEDGVSADPLYGHQ